MSIMLFGTQDNSTVPTLISLTISKSCQVSFKKVAADELWAEYSCLENHLELHLQGEQGFTAIPKWKFAPQSCKNPLNILYGVYIDKRMHLPCTGWKGKRKAMQVYTTQFSPTHRKNINA